VTLKPNIPIKVVVGPRKCGTTTLHSLLSQVPGIAVPSPLKEAHLFDLGSVAKDELPGFCGKTWSEATRGFVDVATHYFSQEELWPNIKETDGVIEVVVIVRDPVERAVSHCMHQMRIKNLWHLTFSDIVDLYPEVITDSSYSVVIPNLKAFFGEGSLRLIEFKRLTSDPMAVVSSLCGDFELVESLSSISLEKNQMNLGFRPRFPWAYSALRGVAQTSRSVLGVTPVELIKDVLMTGWPASGHSVTKNKILNEMSEDSRAQALVQEREYIAQLIENG